MEGAKALCQTGEPCERFAGDIDVLCHDVAAGVAGEEVRKLGVADQTADTVGVAELGGVAGAHVAADVDGGKAPVKRELVPVARRKLVGTGNAVGFRVADQTADRALTAHAIPVLRRGGVVIILCELGTGEARVCRVDIHAAVLNIAVVARAADECAGAGVVFQSGSDASYNRNSARLPSPAWQAFRAGRCCAYRSGWSVPR